MHRKHPCQFTSVALSLAISLSFAAASFTAAQQPAAGQVAQPATDAAKYIRVKDTPSGDRIKLQVSVRTLKPADDTLPVVHLVGVVHIGDQAYYDKLQEFLDAQDLVLFEGVKPGGAESELANADDAAKAKLTKARQRMLGALAERHKKKHGQYPASLADLIGKLPGTTARLAGPALKDAWGHPQRFITTGDPPESFDIVSKGADGTWGGEEGDADIKFSEQKPLTKAEKEGGGEGIQTQLADALGLKFQLPAMDYSKPNWRNSDLNIDQVQAKMDERGANADALFSLIDGQSIVSKIAGFMLGFIKASPQLSLTMKVMMIETIANADDMIAMQGKSGGAGISNMGAMMKVLIQDRNAEVFKDLRRVIDTEKDIKSIAIFFGAGHLPDMEEHLDKDFGYTFDEDKWFNAIDVDLTGQPAMAAQAKQMRAMVRRMAEQAKAEATK